MAKKQLTFEESMATFVEQMREAGVTDKTIKKVLEEIQQYQSKQYEILMKQMLKNMLENEELQKKTGLAKLRKENMELRQQILDLKIQKTDLLIQLDDLKGFYRQEKQAKEELLRQRNRKRTYRPRVKKEVKNGE